MIEDLSEREKARHEALMRFCMDTEIREHLQLEGDMAKDYFGDKVPDFKKDHMQGLQVNAPMTTPREDVDDPATMLPKFVPVQVAIDMSHSIANSATNATRDALHDLGMSAFQVDYITRCIFDATQQLLLGQDAWNWDWRYADAVARGQVPDPRAEDT